MLQNRRSPASVQRTQRHFTLLIALAATSALSAQSFVNGDFESDSTGWSRCIVEIGTPATYGGTGSGHVAEVDGDMTTSPADDRVLCQDIPGFTIGSMYRIEFDATRRGNNSPPEPVSVTMTLDDALHRTITRTGGYAMVREGFYFTATHTTHDLLVTPDFQGSIGMLFDNFSITLVSVLPIQLIDFNAEVVDSGVHLSWITASEQNNDYFTVQRSTDGLVFEDVLRIPGAGTSQTPLTYTAVDPAPVIGLSYYRLQQTDFNDSGTSFHIVPVQFSREANQPLAVYPNPSSGEGTWLYLRDLEEEVRVPLSITDLQGSLIYRNTITLQPGVPVDLTALVDLSPGTYALSVPLAGAAECVRLLVF